MDKKKEHIISWLVKRFGTFSQFITPGMCGRRVNFGHFLE